MKSTGHRAYTEAGRGTGLGLSLSYDTIKAHGGELGGKPRKEGKAEFCVQLPDKKLVA